MKRIGNLEAYQIVESEMPLLGTTELFPQATPDQIERHRDWLHPRYIDYDLQKIVLCFQSYLIASRHHLILVDSCVGENKERPRPEFHQKKWPWMENLIRAGFRPEDIDIVMCTHMHVDHVGWNTRRKDGRWVPTFPNATYLFCSKELQYWQAEAEKGPDRAGPYIEDSVLPVIEAGQAKLIDTDYAVDDEIWLTPAAGHTPGAVIVNLHSGDSKAAISGDIFHTPLQVRVPEWSTAFCVDPEQSAATRRRFLDEHANTGTVIMPAHFPSPSVGQIVGGDDGFDFVFDHT